MAAMPAEVRGEAPSATLGPEPALPEDGGADVEQQASEPTKRPKDAPAPIRNLYVAAMSYNAYTITDGALRLIILIHADNLGFGALEIAFMFSTYEVAGVFTNLFGGVVGSKFGLRFTLLSSLYLQILSLTALALTDQMFGDLEDTSGNKRLQATIYITACQTFAGVAKDFMKLTGKSTPKLVTKEGQEGRLFELVAWLTGMKNALKGFGHFLGAVLVEVIEYVWSLVVLICICVAALPFGHLYMDKELGKGPVKKINWHSVLHKGRRVNLLSAARFFLFGSRDVWFEIGLPIFLKNELGWNPSLVGLVMAGYIVVYGSLQASSTNLYKSKGKEGANPPKSTSVWKWAAACAVVPLVTGSIMYVTQFEADSNVSTAIVLCFGLGCFAVLFAVNSAVHSYLIVSYSDKDKVAQDLGFYYMANAGGRLVGTLLGGALYEYTHEDFGLSLCLWVATPFLLAAALIGAMLDDPPPKDDDRKGAAGNLGAPDGADGGLGSELEAEAASEAVGSSEEKTEAPQLGAEGGYGGPGAAATMAADASLGGREEKEPEEAWRDASGSDGAVVNAVRTAESSHKRAAIVGSQAASE